MPRTVRRVVVFVAGLLLIVLGLLLIVLPGPLTIPPIVAGLWLWSREFEFAKRWLSPMQARLADTWAVAKQKPVHTVLVTGLGLVVAGLVIWATVRYDLVDRGGQLVGLG